MDSHIISINTDGGARGNPGPAACAVVIKENNKIIFEKGYYLGETTNNVAEYSAVYFAYKWLKENLYFQKKCTINFYMDSQLVVNQLTGKYKIKNIKLKNISLKIKEIESHFFPRPNYNFVYRERNKDADRILNKVLDEKS